MRPRHVGHCAVIAGNRIEGNPYANQGRIADGPESLVLVRIGLTATGLFIQRLVLPEPD